MSPRFPRTPWWQDRPDADLLRVRLCDLDLQVEGSPVGPRLAQLYEELERAGLRFRPHTWFSTDWFTPHGVPGFAVPFYLAHPRLAALERRYGEGAEGVDRRECLQLLRHEAGHAIDNAYHLHRRADWRQHFGAFSTPYRVRYRARLGDSAFVRHLAGGYAQSHPGEDFAETFAVWLAPRSGWRRRYAGKPALRKLLYVDAVTTEIAQRPARCRAREHTDSLAKLRYPLVEHYRRRRARYAASRAAGRARAGGKRGASEFYR